jgi:hypothetical protein
MAYSRRRFGALLAATTLTGTAGCSALTNDDIELAIENRTGQGDQRFVAYVYQPGGERGEPVYDSVLPGGSRQIVGDVTPAPPEGEQKDVAVDVEGETAQVSDVVTVTGPGTIAALFSRSGVTLEFGARD